MQAVILLRPRSQKRITLSCVLRSLELATLSRVAHIACADPLWACIAVCDHMNVFVGRRWSFLLRGTHLRLLHFLADRMNDVRKRWSLEMRCR